MGNKKEIEVHLPDGIEVRPRSKPELPVAEIPFSEFVAAKQDPKVAEFLESVKVENDRLTRAGKIHF